MKKLLIGVLAAALLLAACGGSSKKSVDAAGDTTTTAKDGTSDTTSGSNGNDDDLSSLLGDYAKARIKITYKSGTDDELITIAQDGSGKSAYTSGDSTFYSDGKTSVSCEGTGSTATCTDMGALGATGAGLGSIFTATFASLASLADTLGVGDKSSDTIAGRDATCVKYKASDFLGKLSSLPLFEDDDLDSEEYDADDSATICVDKESGFLLKISSTKKGVAEDQFLATEVGEPSDSDFEPPVTPETLPSFSIPSIPAG